MKQKLLTAMLALLLLFLGACGKGDADASAEAGGEEQKQESPAPQENTDAPREKPADPSEDVWSFHGITWQEGELGAVALVGFSEDVFSEDILRVFYAYDARYNDFSGGSIGGAEAEGNEVYLIIPRWSDTVISVTELVEGAAGEQLYSDIGMPFLLRCNLSDLYPNTLVTFTSSQGTLTFSPSISLMDGSVVLPEGGLLRDVTDDSLN